MKIAMWAFASAPYVLIAFAVMFSLNQLQFFRWHWDNPPSYVRFILGILWPIWVLAFLIMVIFGKNDENDNQS